MGQRHSRSHHAIATLICLMSVAFIGCAGPGVVQPDASNEQPEPSRGPCGGAIVMTVWHAQADGPSPACSTAGPLASGSPWPVSIRAAARAFRDFTGESSLPFNVEGPFDTAGRREYDLSSQGLNGRALYVDGSVDADNGRVTSVGYTPKAVDGPGPRAISKEAATADAAEYLSAHSIDVATLSSFVAPTERGWEITWEQLDGAVGVPPRVVVTVEWMTGTVVSFREIRFDHGSPPAAAITRAQAEAAAVKDTWLTSPVVEDARLRLEVGWDGSSTLVWEVYGSGKGDRVDGPTYFTIRVDARTGQVI